MAAIVKRFPGSCRVTSVFVGTRETDDFFNQPDRLPDTLVRVIELLSGLTFDELSPLGVFRAFDPVEDRVLVTTEPGSAAFDDWRRPRVPKE
ncbi:MAG TPA: hypothetical protein VFI31_21200 [Pirellulales bacterium]|nr:hypothetical protein [Pirellulales bacterium]